MDIRIEIETRLYTDEPEPLIQKVVKEDKGVSSDDGEMYTIVESIYQALLGMGYSELTICQFIDQDGQIPIR